VLRLYGLTQTLAAAPQLVAWWEDARTANPYAWAVLTAALDAIRLGARAPLTAAFLHEAAPGYCTSRQRAEARAQHGWSEAGRVAGGLGEDRQELGVGAVWGGRWCSAGAATGQMTGLARPAAAGKRCAAARSGAESALDGLPERALVWG
jgi:hypothetical protein